jgi:hypothetical protein
MGLKIQVLDRAFLSTYLFAPTDVIVTLGQDGLVANTAKYVKGQPILAVNPDPARFDGILLPIRTAAVRMMLERTLAAKVRSRLVTMAEARLRDGQRLLAFNDLFIGARSHISARYRLTFNKKTEDHSSSGIIVSTGAGSSGWLSSIFNETIGLVSFLGGTPVAPVHLEWEDDALLFVVREPFVSRQSSAGIVAGRLARGEPLAIESQMPAAGVIFSDGIESDSLDFNSGAIASIGIAPERANLVMSESA